jgi:hypothetical protein
MDDKRTKMQESIEEDIQLNQIVQLKVYGFQLLKLEELNLLQISLSRISQSLS